MLRNGSLRTSCAAVRTARAGPSRVGTISSRTLCAFRGRATVPLRHHEVDRARAREAGPRLHHPAEVTPAPRRFRGKPAS